jgi:N-acyl homoserine lactone hydrolase
MRLRLASDDIVLAGDSCYFCRTLRERRLPRFAYDHAQMHASLDRLAMLEAGARASSSATTPNSGRLCRRRRS